jgi:hypothetical protein
MSRSFRPSGRLRIGLLVAVLAATLGDKGCDPNYIGVQEYGAITGRIIDAKSNGPISNALISVGSLYVTRSDPKGAFTLPKVPIGTQQVVITATGYVAPSPIPVAVGKDKTAVIPQPVALQLISDQGLPAPSSPPSPAATASSASSPAPPAATSAPGPKAP